MSNQQIRFFLCCIIFLISVAGLISGCSPAQTKPSKTPEGPSDNFLATAEFYDSQRGFLFQYPAGWDIENLGSHSPDRWDMLIQKDLSGNRAMIHFTYFDSIELDSIYLQEKNTYCASNDKVVNESEVEFLEDVNSRVVEASFDDLDVRYMKMYVILIGNKVFRFSIALEEKNPNLLDSLEQCVQSIQNRKYFPN